MRRAAKWLIAVPVAIIAVWFAVANRGFVLVTLYPAPVEQEIRLFVIAFAALAIGFVGGAVVVWLGGRKWRRLARARKREADSLAREVERLGERSESRGTETPQVPPTADAETG